MDIDRLFLLRRSIRTFKKKPVCDDTIKKILLAASLAPTARNIQPWEFIVVKNEKTKNEIARLTRSNAPFLAEAPVCIAVFCRDCKYYLEDGCCATTHALLRAASLGLGACWVAGDKKDYCRQIAALLCVPSEFKLVSLIAIGYSDEKPAPEKRKTEELVHFERF